MLAGEGAVAIWNGIAEEGRKDFYDWHLHEHMPERLGIPGFLRGRRYRAADKETQPEFFTLYETSTFEVTQGLDYLNRLNAPTPWTKRATSHFQTTSRSLTRVLASFGPGQGGALMTLRFDVPDGDAEEVEALRHLLLTLSSAHEISGTHLLKSDDAASVAKTNESKGRRDIEAPANWVILIEACSAKALKPVLGRLRRKEILKTAVVGRYLHEFTRLKTAFSAG